MEYLGGGEFDHQSFPDSLVVCTKVTLSSKTPLEVSNDPIFHRHDVLAIEETLDNRNCLHKRCHIRGHLVQLFTERRKFLLAGFECIK